MNLDDYELYDMEDFDLLYYDEERLDGEIVRRRNMLEEEVELLTYEAEVDLELMY